MTLFSSKMFNEKLDLKLIRLVKDNPVLYDYNNAKYMDFNAREVAWQKIGDELEKPPADCKVRWINIRDVSRRILRKSLCEATRPKRAYKYHDAMAFMRPYYKDGTNRLVPTADESDEGDKSYDQWNNVVIEYNDEPDPCSDDSDEKPIRERRKVKSSRKSAKKRKEHSYEEEEKPTTSTYNEAASEFDAADPVDAFLLSIGATLKTFSPYHLNLAKSKIFGVVQEHDLQQIVQKQQDALSDVKILSEGIYLQE